LFGNPPSQNSAEIAELSETFNRLGRYLGIATSGDYRNVNGVYMRPMNFRLFDPTFTGAGRSGLPHSGREEEAVKQAPANRW
jgi:5-methylcytosine-specific restriction protein A